MRLVIIGDLHLDAKIAGRDYHEDVLAKLRSIPIRPGDHVIQLGDVTDPDGPASYRALDAMVAWLRDFPKGAFATIIVGNHDRIDDARAFSSISALAALRNVEVINAIDACWLVGHDRPEREQIRAIYIPWRSRAHGEFDTLTEVRGILDLGSDAMWIVFCHLDIEGAVPGSEDDMTRLGRQWLPREIVEDPRVAKVFAGHIHKAQRIGEKIEIVGSLECLGMGERTDDNKGWIEVEL